MARSIWLMALSTVALTLASCGGTSRSAHAVCNVWRTDGKALHDQLEARSNDASSDPFGTLASIAGTPGKVASLMDKLAAVAPTNVEPNFKNLAAAFHDMANSEGAGAIDPLAALASGLAGAFNTQDDVEAVDHFLRRCGGGKRHRSTSRRSRAATTSDNPRAKNGPGPNDPVSLPRP